MEQHESSNRIEYDRTQRLFSTPVHPSRSEEAYALADTLTTKHRYLEDSLAGSLSHVKSSLLHWRRWRILHAALARVPGELRLSQPCRGLPNSPPAQPPRGLVSEEGAPSSCTKTAAGGWLRTKTRVTDEQLRLVFLSEK